jgi:hypothetical protein
MSSVWIVTLENRRDSDVGLIIEGVYASEIAAISASQDSHQFGWVDRENDVEPGRWSIVVQEWDVEE